MDLRQNLITLFDNNNIDYSYFDLDAFEIEAKQIGKKIQDVKSRNPTLTYEPVYSHNQKRSGTNR